MSTVLSTLNDDLAREIREARHKAMLTQAELAELVGCSMRAVQDWEAGVSVPRAKYRRALVRVFREIEGAAA